MGGRGSKSDRSVLLLLLSSDGAPLSSNPLFPLRSPLADHNNRIHPNATPANRSLARAGLKALVRLDKRFAPFADSLFSRAALGVSRDQLTAEENAKLDESLDAFLRLLADHFLAPAAFQVLEFCIRRYKCGVFAVRRWGLVCAPAANPLPRRHPS